MAPVKRVLTSGVATAGVVLAGLYVVGSPALAQRGGGNSTQATTPAQTAKPPVKIAGDFDKVKILEPGGATPRSRDGHPDLSGRYYPNHAGRMLQAAVRSGQDAPGEPGVQA